MKVLTKCLAALAVATALPAAVALTPAPCQAESAHWGVFFKGGSAGSITGQADYALHRRGFNLWMPASERRSVVIGSKGNVVVTVSCIPMSRGNTRIVVVAVSPDPAAAEAERNAIRTEIQGMRTLD
jgi:hypothetical protein